MLPGLLSVWLLTANSFPCDQTTGLHATAGANDLTIAISNLQQSSLCLSFASNGGSGPLSGAQQPTSIGGHASTQYHIPTGWAGRIGVGPNLNENASKIEASFPDPAMAYIDVSYVDGFSVPIVCSTQGRFVSGCGVDLFAQGFDCPNLVPGPVCLNPSRSLADGPPQSFFEACAGKAYIYLKDDNATQGVSGSYLV